MFHVLNRAALRKRLFNRDADYDRFEALMAEARQHVDVPLLAYSLMPTHFHFVVWPRNDPDMSEFMRWLTLTHTQRTHARKQTIGTGALVQGRFKSFPVQQDVQLRRVCRYVERNPLRAGLCKRAEDWPWTSLAQRGRNRPTVMLDPWPIPQPSNWIQYVNEIQTQAELAEIRRSVRKSIPLGEPAWVEPTARALRIESRLRPRGRPALISDTSARV